MEILSKGQVSTSDERMMAMFIHIAALFHGIGYLIALIIWLTRREQSSFIDANGKVVFNWVLSEIIYGFVCALLFIVLIGIPLVVALGVCSVVFAIIGAIRANEGIVWKYPIAIEFFK